MVAILRLWLSSLLLIVTRLSSPVAALTDFELQLGRPGLYNPSLVFYKGRYMTVARETSGPTAMVLHGSDVIQVQNRVYVCTSRNLTQPHACQLWDPWQGIFDECSWGQHVYDRIGNTAYTGVDDTKLFVWPGKGLFSITGRHQELVNSSEPICRDFNWMQYITQVVPETESGSSWHLARPVPMRLADESKRYEGKKGIWEKNWMAFVHSDELYVTYQLSPWHLVYKYVSPTQPLQLAHATTSDIIKQRFPKGKVHGGPPVVYVPGNLTSTGKDYYLGVLHARHRTATGIEMPHYLYKMAPQPPFQLIGVSKEQLPLIMVEGKQQFAFASGLWLDHTTGQVLLSYGSSDAAARVMLFQVREVDSMFPPYGGSRQAAKARP